MSVIGLYRPDQAPVYRSQSSMQIGAYTSEQTVDRSRVIGASAAVAANVALANFLSVSGQLKSIGDLYPNSLSVRELEPLLVFA
jgi:hypothetical protein